MTGRVRRWPCTPPSLGDFVAVVPTSPVGGPARLLLSGISFAIAPTSPAGGPARLLLSGISSVVAPTSPAGGPSHLLLSEISFAGAPASPAACGGAVQTGKRKSAFK